MARKLILMVLAIGVAAIIGAASSRAAELTSVSVERLGNKMVVHFGLDGGSVPILKYDQEARVMSVTLKGTSFKDVAPGELGLTEHERLWLDSVVAEPGDQGMVVKFHLGPSADPLNFIVSSDLDEILAIVYTDGSTGPLSAKSMAEQAPAEKIKSENFSAGIVLPDAEAKPAAEEPKQPAEPAPGEEAVLSTGDKGAPAVPSFVIDSKLPVPPLVLSAGDGSGNVYEDLFGGAADEGFRTGGGGQTVTLEVDQMPLSQVIALLVASTDYNVLVSDAVSGKNISALSMKNISLFEALDLITRSNNLSYIVEHNTIVIGEKDVLEENFGKLITKTFWLDYADGATVAKLITDMKLARENNIQVYNGEIEYLPVNGATSLSGDSTVKGFKAGNIRPMQSLISSARRNMIVVTETEDRMTRIAQVIAELDKKPKQVRLETEIVEISESGSKKLGLELLNTSSQIKTTFGEAVPPDSLVAGKVESFSLQTFVRDPLQFQVALNTLINDGDGKVLAKPNMAVIDGAQAIYFAGREVPYITAPAQSQGATFTPASVDFKTIGITLNFKPRIDRDDNITIEINPQVSTLLGFLDLGAGASAPDTLTRQATTTIRVKSGDTFILGGMLSETEKESFKKVPLLSKIPFFGQLFETRDWTKEKTEIVVIVRPVIEE